MFGAETPHEKAARLSREYTAAQVELNNLTAKGIGPGNAAFDNELRHLNSLQSRMQALHAQMAKEDQSLTPAAHINYHGVSPRGEKTPPLPKVHALHLHATHLAAAHARLIRSDDTWMNSVFSAAGNVLSRGASHYNAALAAVTRGTNPMQAIRDKYAAYAHTLASWGNPAAAAEALQAGDHAANKEGYKLSMQKLAALQKQLAAEEKLIAVRKQTGAISSLQAEQQDIAAQKGIAPQMEKAAEAALSYARALKDPALTAALEAQIAQIKAMGTQLNQIQKGITRTFQSGIQGFLQQFMLGRETWRTMFMQLNNAIMTGINHTIAQNLAQSITGSASHSSAGQGFLGLFGGGSGSSGGSSWLSSIGSWFAKTFMGNSFAVGTDSVPHDMVAQIHAGERIIPAATNQKLTEMLSSGALGGHQINLNITAMDSQSVLGAMSGISRELAQMLSGTNAAYNLGT